jgi:predicted site-specific integrase-resolvase
LQQTATIKEAAMPLFTIADAARAAGVDRATLYRHIKAGKLSLSRDEKGKRGVDAAELASVFFG